MDSYIIPTIHFDDLSFLFFPQIKTPERRKKENNRFYCYQREKSKSM